MRRTASTLLSLVLTLSACGGGDAASEDTEVPRTSTPESTSTDPEETDAPTTTQEPTTTVDPATQADLTVLITISAIESTRTDLISAIESDFILERVDVFETRIDNGPPASAVLYVSGSSGYGTAEYQIEKAWELATTLATFWESGDASFRNESGNLKPALEIVVDGRRYYADHDLMVRVADRKVTQQEWLMLAKG